MSKKQKAAYINREVSWLSFNERVLQEAEDKSNPLIERMRFLGIYSNNLDEFFKVRVATLNRARLYGGKQSEEMGFDPGETLQQIQSIVIRQASRFDKVFQHLQGELKKAGITFVNETGLNRGQRIFVEQYFETTVRPNLIPVMLSPKATFPELNDVSAYLAIDLGYKSAGTPGTYALLEIPPSLPRLVELPVERGQRYLMFIDDVIRYRLRRVFGIFNYDFAQAYSFKLTRDAELDVDDDLSKGLVEKMSRSLSLRKRGRYVRINYDQQMPAALLDFLLKKTKLNDRQNIIPGSRYHNKRDLMSLPDFGKPALRFNPWPALPHPQLAGQSSIMAAVAKQDLLLHFPYHNFTTVVDLLLEAAIDPQVRSIRINLYRVARHSQVVNALMSAACNGKKVTAVVELQARFDEENNIAITRTLQEAGVKVIPGVPGLKVHCKLLQISRRENGTTVRYAAIGTGNFHERTSAVYSDITLLTANPDICSEVRRMFDFFENNYQRIAFRHLIVSPFGTRRKLTELINAEIVAAEKGNRAWITLKLNNLVDPGLIKKLYEASTAGVKIDLLIRGTCSLVPGIKGTSDNIKVRSIVGRYLEHTRIFVFCNDGDPAYYISSADWMTRNMEYRVEVTTPVYDPRLKAELKNILSIQAAAGAKARIVDRTLKNEYQQPPGTATAFDTQLRTWQYLKKQK
ncbi:MAG: polyphosphate kinase 1 [Flavobacteriales bacterium]